MARDKGTLSKIDNSNPADYPNARIKNNTGGGDGTPVNEFVYGDIHEMLAKIMRLYDIPYNGLPDNETNGYQLVSALEALASKNDYVLDMSSASDILRIPIKLGKLRENESIVLKATVNKGVETTIRGTLDNVTKAVTFLGNFKINEYVRLINTPTSVVLVRLIDSFNLQSAVSDLGFLTGATQAEEDAGTISNKATTPLRNKTTFAKRVNGSQSGNYLVTQSRNGLMSKEDKEALDNITEPESIEKNYGVVRNIEIDSGYPTGTNFPVSGNITQATKTGGISGGEVIRCTLENAMDSLNYEVSVSIEYLGNDQYSNDLYPITFKKISTTQFQFTIQETGTSPEIYNLHFSIKQR